MKAFKQQFLLLISRYRNQKQILKLHNISSRHEHHLSNSNERGKDKDKGSCYRRPNQTQRILVKKNRKIKKKSARVTGNAKRASKVNSRGAFNQNLPANALLTMRNCNKFALCETTRWGLPLSPSLMNRGKGSGSCRGRERGLFG